MDTEFRCRVKNISKEFPGVKALNNVSFDILPGEIHAIVGENGAGKSTLMNILSGVYPPDGGHIEFDGEERNYSSTKEAQESGVSMIHQELSLFKAMTVFENIFIGRMPKKATGVIDNNKMIADSKKQLNDIGVNNIDPRVLVKTLSVSQMQLVEISKAISLKAKMLIMDEPTSSLTTAEIKQVLEIMQDLRNQGVSILFITHKLEEVMEVADRITVLRDGEKIDTLNKSETTIPEIVTRMVGRDFEKAAHRDFINDYSGRKVVLEVKNLNVPGLVQDASFKLYEGEVLGLTGLVGAGRSELLQGVFGMYPKSTGEIFFEGKKVEINHPKDAVELGLGLVPEGRKEQGMFLKLDVRENMTLVNRRKMANTFKIIDDREVTRKAKDYVKELSIKTPSLSQVSSALSGGNQQKTIIARWLMNKPKVIFMDEPTHGIDIGAKKEIYGIIDELAKQNVSVILLSSELPEVLGLCDRIMVMHRGRIAETLKHDEANEVSIMNHAFNQA